MNGTFRRSWWGFTRDWGLLGLLGSVVLIGSAVVIHLVQFRRAETRFAQRKADLEEHVPPGSTRKEAERWFAAHGISPGLTGKAGQREAGYFAIVLDNTLLESAEIDITINFDEQGRVTNSSIDRWVLCL